MGIKDDFEGLTQTWKTLSAPIKVFLAANFLVSSLSIASISDSIFKFKGFIKAAVEFYQLCTGMVLGFLTKYVYIDLVQVQIDVIILFLLFGGAFYRSLIKYNVGGRVKYWSGYTVFLSIYIVVMAAPGTGIEMIIGYFFSIMILATIYPLLHSNIVSSKIVAINKAALLYIYAIFIFIGVVAAVSDGLSRTA